MPRAQLLRVFFAVLSLLALRSLPSSAEPEPEVAAPPARDLAREEFRAASDLAQSGGCERALPLFRSSYEHYPHATTLFNSSHCHEQLGDPAGALRDLLDALRLGAEDSSRALSPERSALALAAVETLKARLAEREPAGTGADSGELASGTPSTPGGPGAEASEPTPPRKHEDGIATRAPRSARSAPALVPGGTSTLGGSGRVLVLAGGGVALGGLVAGAVALDTKRKLDERCDPNGACGPGQEPRITRFRNAVRLANVGLTVGALAAATGAVLLVVDSSRTPRASVRLGLGNVAVAGTF